MNEGRTGSRPGSLRRLGARAGPGEQDPNDSERGESDRGAVTVEAALALCSLAVFLAVAVGAVVAVAATIRCIDASRELARLAARGEPERGRTVAAALAPSGARMELVREGDTVRATVSARWMHPLPLRISGQAVAALEPGVAGP
jgi:hypothetical protein